MTSRNTFYLIIGVLCITLVIGIIAFSQCSQESIPQTTGGMPLPIAYANLDDLLHDVAFVRFDENRRPWRWRDATFISELDKLYVPINVPEDFPLFVIIIETFIADAPIRFVYSLPNFRNFVDPLTERATLTWRRDRPTDEVFFRGGGRLESPSSSDNVMYHWTQHGYEFEVHILATFPEEDAYEITSVLLNPQPFTTWELQGNAISFSIQGIESINIFDDGGQEISYYVTVPDDFFSSFISRLSQELNHHVLYSRDVGGKARYGYSWLTDEETSRRQFVLKPGTYTFIVDGIIGEPQLVIRHFYNREVVSSVDFTEYLASQDFTSFTVTVTPDNTGSGDTVVINP